MTDLADKVRTLAELPGFEISQRCFRFSIVEDDEEMRLQCHLDTGTWEHRTYEEDYEGYLIDVSIPNSAGLALLHAKLVEVVEEAGMFVTANVAQSSHPPRHTLFYGIFGAPVAQPTILDAVIEALPEITQRLNDL